MKRLAICLFALLLLLLAGCAEAPQEQEPSESPTPQPGFTQITQQQAREMMARDDGHVVLDVRRQDEYDSGHIPGALLLPNELITDTPPEALPDPEQIILIYCRSGNRSKQAAQKLADMGYTNLYEFGGIIDWTGDVVTTEQEQG